MIVLASTSPTRQSLLANAGIAFHIEPPNINETALVASNPSWSPPETAYNLATAKACDVSHARPHHTVIGADQVLACDGRIYSKPRDNDDGRRQLLQLRGKTHSLISSVVSARNGVQIWTVTQTAVLRMRCFSSEFLEAYLSKSSDHLTSSVGGYQLERQGLQLFDSIEGDYFTILGLPMLPLLQHLRFIGELQS